MRHVWQPLVQLIGRCCLGLAFLSSAAARVRDFHERCGLMTLDGVPVSEFLLGCWIALALVGALSVAVGWRSRTGLALLAICTLLGLWTEPAGIAVLRMGLSPLATNLALLAALLTLLASGPGAWSFDAHAAGPAPDLGDSNVLG